MVFWLLCLGSRINTGFCSIRNGNRLLKKWKLNVFFGNKKGNEMENDELKSYYALFTDCWKFFKKYAQEKNINDNLWNCMINDAEKIRHKYDGKEAAYQVLWGTQQALDKIWTQKENERKRNEQTKI